MSQKNKYTVAILGATGAVGRRMIEQLERSSVPVGELRLLASRHSEGKKLKFKNQELTVHETKPESFSNVDIVLASAGGSISKKFLPEAVKRGAICIDNTSAFRMDPTVPLVVPEVNRSKIKEHHGIIANPNCSTIQMVVALEPIRKKYGLKQVIVSTYQAGSGAGQAAMDELFNEAQEKLNGEQMEAKIFPTKGETQHYPLAFNLLPQIDVFEDDGYSHEEWKMIHETKKIMCGDMNDPQLKVTATCVRVPVAIGHGESIYFQTKDSNVTADELRNLLRNAPGITVQDDPSNQIYPQPLNAEGKRDTFVGQIRPDLENKGCFNMWNVADNLLKGAAWNAVQIAECLVSDNII